MSFNLWAFHTEPHLNRMAVEYPAFLTDEQKARLERIRHARLLFDGLHFEYFVKECRTQFEFKEVRVEGVIFKMYLRYNLLRLIATKSADLLLGEEPLLRVDDPTQQDELADLSERTSLHAVLQSAALDCAYEGDCFLVGSILRGRGYLEQIPGDEIFVDGRLMPDGQYERYVRMQLHNRGSESKPDWMLLKTIYRAGAIDRELWQVGTDTKLTGRIELNNWPDAQGWRDSQPTGIAENIVTWIPNLLARRRPISDFDGLIDLQDRIGASNTQIARILSRHADPKMVVPEDASDREGNFPAAAEVLFKRDGEPNPYEYLSPADAGQLVAAMEDRKFAINAALVASETSPVLLGMKEGAAPDAYKKVRLEAFSSITKAQRKSIYWKAGIHRAVMVAQKLDNAALPAGARYTVYPIGVELRDGIPMDAQEMADRQATLRSAGLLSQRRALTEQLQDPAAVENELNELKKEAAAAAPSALLGEPGADGSSTSVDDEEQIAA